MLVLVFLLVCVRRYKSGFDGSKGCDSNACGGKVGTVQEIASAAAAHGYDPRKQGLSCGCAFKIEEQKVTAAATGASAPDDTDGGAEAKK